LDMDDREYRERETHAFELPFGLRWSGHARLAALLRDLNAIVWVVDPELIKRHIHPLRRGLRRRMRRTENGPSAYVPHTRTRHKNSLQEQSRTKAKSTSKCPQEHPQRPTMELRAR
jgi:hypothetical protein